MGLTLHREALKLIQHSAPTGLQEDSLASRHLRALMAVTLSLFATASFSQSSSPVSLDTSETLFTAFTALNACGFDTELGASDVLRNQIRTEVAKNIQASDHARETVHGMCQFYGEHQQRDASRTVAQYISLALYVNGPPNFAPKVKESELPPDAMGVLGMLSYLQKFYDQAGIHGLWEKHRVQYAALSDRYHAPVSKMLFDTEIYLKLPSAGYLGHQFTVYIDPMGAPGQSNARNYGSDYYVVISPGSASSLKLDQVRHTYLHYLLDPLAAKYPMALKRLDPVLEAVRTAPMDESFKSDAGLLVTECLIRAIEIRTSGTSKAPVAEREKQIDDSVAQGFVLTRYFYDTLAAFEKDPVGLRNAYSGMLSDIEVGKEVKRISQIEFASTADPELLHLSRPATGKLLITAEQQLATGDVDSARRLAQQALEENSEDPGRALFVLAQASIKEGKIDEARDYFARTLTVAHENKVVAWSHIYLGRIFDLEQDRDTALDHYRAAMDASSDLPEVKVAAQRGIEQPYELPRRPE